MSAKNIHLCIDKIPGHDFATRSLYHAATERNDNLDSINHLLNESQPVRHALRAARIYRTPNFLKQLKDEHLPLLQRMCITTTKMWASGRTLRVRFLNGSDYLHNKVIRYAQEWERYVNLRFFFVGTGPTEIRISFRDQPGSESCIGTDCLLVTDQDVPTMSFGGLDEETAEVELSSVILHEFGHTIGCVHEHQHPKNTIRWNKPKVYDDYKQFGWSPQDVNKFLFRRYSEEIANGSEYDPQSIMHYPIPAEHLKKPSREVRLNSYLSTKDIEFAKRNYPFK